MDFSIVTPSFRQPQWLRLCLASVADQAGVTHEHIIQDNESGAEVAEVCRGVPQVRLVQEHDAGMYDAVNRGLRVSRGRICAYLNCDEQYLPDALQRVSTFFDRHPGVDVVFGDVVVVDADGVYVCSRQVLTPLRFHTATCQLNTFTAATFFRRRVFEECGCWFDPAWRNAGDTEWILRLLARGTKMATMAEYIAVFTDTGANLGMVAEGERERRLLRRQVPAVVQALRPLWVWHHRFRRVVHGHYRPRQSPFRIYRRKAEGRVALDVVHPTAVWRSRLSAWR